MIDSELMTPNAKTIEARVSVIIPAYNAERFLRVAIDSVLQQTYPPAEIIVVNDGSADATRQVAQAYGEQILYLEQPNLGQAAARNLGLETASGDMIAFLDADDFWRPEFLDSCVSFLVAHPDVVAVHTGCEALLENGDRRLLPSLMESPSARGGTPFVIDNLFRHWAEQGCLLTGAIVVRSNVARTIGGQRVDLRVSQDLEFWALVALRGKWGFVPRPLYVNTSRPNARGNWKLKYQTRRRLCPTIDSWQQRILPAVHREDALYFSIIRGRIVASFAHNYILAGRQQLALETVRRYSDELPRNRMTLLLRLGACMGEPMWWFVCLVLRIREAMKS